jgi:hypothetical protein
VGNVKKHCEVLNPPVDCPLNFVSRNASPCTDSISWPVNKAQASSFGFTSVASLGVVAGTTVFAGLTAVATSADGERPDLALQPAIRRTNESKTIFRSKDISPVPLII